MQAPALRAEMSRQFIIFAGRKSNVRTMKFLILSDIHGSRPALERVLRHYDEGGYDLLLLLGDLLNYGPRNGLSEGLDAPGTAALLAERARSIVAVRGNCDSEVDQMLLPFPIMAPYALVCDGPHRLFLTHGHLFDTEALPFAEGVDVVLSGHTHLWSITPAAGGGPAQCNAGSPTFPKGGNVPTFATLCDGMLAVRRAADAAVLEQLRVY